MNITERALFARVQRKLAHNCQYLKRCRESARSYADLGRYFAVNERNHISDTHIDLEALGRELGVLRPGEATAAA